MARAYDDTAADECSRLRQRRGRLGIRWRTCNFIARVSSGPATFSSGGRRAADSFNQACSGRRQVFSLW